MLVCMITVGAEIIVWTDCTLPSQACDTMFSTRIARNVGMSDTNGSRIEDTKVIEARVSCPVVGSGTRVPLDNHSLLRGRGRPDLVIKQTMSSSQEHL